jgi:hypothetical protein
LPFIIYAFLSPENVLFNSVHGQVKTLKLDGADIEFLILPKYIHLRNPGILYNTP